MTKKWEKFSLEEIKQFVKESYSYRELCIKIGYAPDSGNGTRAVKNMIKELNLNASHFKGQGWNKDNFNYDRFKKGSAIKVANALSALTFLRGHKCEVCGNETWNDKPIPLEIHHIDGDHLNNELDNLQILCPNCHAQTDNFKGRNIKKIERTEEEFVEALNKSNNIRQALISLGMCASGKNYDRAYYLIDKYQIKHLMKK